MMTPEAKIDIVHDNFCTIAPMMNEMICMCHGQGDGEELFVRPCSVVCDLALTADDHRMVLDSSSTLS
jgi:hypothetical protein